MVCLVICWWQAQFRIWTLAFVASHGINTLVTAAADIRQRTLVNICENQTLIIIWKTRRRGTKIIRARVRARENPMKPFVRTSFLDTRPSCLPSPGRPFFCTEDRKPNFYLGSTGSPVTTRQIPLGPSLGKQNMQTKDVCSSKIEVLSSLNCVCCRMLQFEC